MKQHLTTACLIFGAVLAAHASIDWEGDTSVTSEGFDTWIIAEAAYASAAPVIDGVIGAGEWSAAIRNVLGEVYHITEYEGEMEGSFSVMWDETNIYIMVEATDSVGMAGQGHLFELYLSTAYTRKFGAWMVPGFEDTDYQISCVMNPEDSFYSLGLYSDQDPLPSFQRANVISGTSYVSEVKIAWADLGGLPSANGYVNSDYIGFEVHTQRNAPPGGKNADRTKLGWAGIEDTAWAATEDWGTLRLMAGGTAGPVSLWADLPADPATGAKQAGIGVINDGEYPYVYHHGAGYWLYIVYEVSSLESILGYGVDGGWWFWTTDHAGGWYFNLSDPLAGQLGWGSW